MTLADTYEKLNEMSEEELSEFNATVEADLDALEDEMAGNGADLVSYVRSTVLPIMAALNDMTDGRFLEFSEGYILAYAHIVSMLKNDRRFPRFELFMRVLDTYAELHGTEKE